MRQADEKTLPCGHDIRYEVEWAEVSNAGFKQHVWFCIACNYESVTKHIKEAPNDQR